MTIAEELAARDALNRLFGLTLDRQPFSFGDEIIHVEQSKSNVSIRELTS